MSHHAMKTVASSTWQEAVLHGSSDGVLLVSRLGVILRANPAAERLLGVRPGKVVGLPLEKFVPARFREFHRGAVAGFFEAGAMARDMAERAPVPVLRGDGRESMADIALVPVTVEGEPAVACVMRDATERLAMEAALVRAEKLESLRVLSAGVAHDFNNIIAVVVGNAEFGLQLVEDGSPVRFALHDIREAGLRAGELVQQMLRFAGKREAVHEPVNLTEVAAEMLRLLERALGDGVRIRTDFDAEPLVVAGDVVGLRQVVMNLVVNAGEAMAGSGTLTVRTGRTEVTRGYLRSCRRKTCSGCESAAPGAYACLEVEDTGTGMDAATRERVFDPYFSTKFAGRGLGLAAVLGVVRGHGGFIVVESERGRGTTFRVYLPLRDGATPGAGIAERG